MPRRIPDADLRADLERVINDLGRPPTVQEYIDHGDYAFVTIAKRFGNGKWTDALRALGHEPPPKRRGPSKIPEHTLQEDLERVVHELRRAPTTDEYNDLGEYSAHLLVDRVGDGSWPDALRALGYEPMFEAPSRIPEEDLRTDLKRVIDSFGRAPTTDEYDAYGEYTANTISKRLGNGSWNEAIRTTGHEPEHPSAGIPERDLWADLKQVADEVEGKPTIATYDEYGTYSPATIARRLGDGSWTTAIDRLNHDADTELLTNPTKQ